MKILALDLGDRWIGTAISDPSCLLARPYKTIERDDLISFLTQVLEDEPIAEIVIGNPKTMRGTESKQTEKVAVEKAELEKQFPTVLWVLWDERLSSKHAQNLRIAKDKTEIHSLAAALILDSYLSYKLFQKQLITD